jgi:hypothetical protein
VLYLKNSAELAFSLHACHPVRTMCGITWVLYYAMWGM